MVIMKIVDLKSALENNESEKNQCFRNECIHFIEEKMKVVGSNFSITRDLFCEGNNITGVIRDVMLTDLDRKTSTVAAGR